MDSIKPFKDGEVLEGMRLVELGYVYNATLRQMLGGGILISQGEKKYKIAQGAGEKIESLRKKMFAQNRRLMAIKKAKPQRPKIRGEHRRP